MLLEKSRYLGKKTIGPVARLGTAGVLLFSSISCSEKKSSMDPNSLDNSQRTERKATDLEFPFTSGDWRFTNGPHPDIEPGVGGLKVLSSLDFAPPIIISCGGDPQDSVKYEEEWVTSPIKGEVILVGDEDDIEDEDHGLVQIRMEKHPEGQILLAHLTDIQVEEGDNVEMGDEVGHASCAHTPGVTNTGVHVHVELRNNNIPIDISKARIVIAGEWEISGNGIRDDGGFYDGILRNVKDEREVRQNGGKCGPDKEAVKRCGFTNYIPQDALLGQNAKNQPDYTPTAETPDSSDSNVVKTCVGEDFICDGRFISRLGFEAPLPEDWTLVNVPDKNGRRQERFFPSGDAKDKVGITVTVENSYGESLDFYKAYTEEGLKGLGILGVAADLQSIEEIEVDGTAAEEFKGEFELKNAGEYSGRYNLDYIIFVKGNKLWTIAYVARQEYDYFGDEVESFIEDFETN